MTMRVFSGLVRRWHAMQLDHVTLVTPDLEAARRFFCEVAGLESGPRPAFAVEGYWLYAEGRPVIHLIDATVPARAATLVAPRLDHFALRVAPGAQWHALIERLDAHCVPYQLNVVPASAERQLFVALAPGVVVEFVTAASQLS
jgi:catechol 2,3-dioxygenase-like lactoylglutathione lyase family enzyme